MGWSRKLRQQRFAAANTCHFCNAIGLIGGTKKCEHIKKVHPEVEFSYNEEGRLICTKCNVKMASFTYLYRHYIVMHSWKQEGEDMGVEPRKTANSHKRHRCIMCGKWFDRILSHVRSAHPEIQIGFNRSTGKYTCGYVGCDYVTPIGAATVIRHFKKTHLVERSKPCYNDNVVMKEDTMKHTKVRGITKIPDESKSILLGKMKEKAEEGDMALEKELGRAVLDVMSEQAQLLKTYEEMDKLQRQEIQSLKGQVKYYQDLEEKRLKDGISDSVRRAENAIVVHGGR